MLIRCLATLVLLIVPVCSQDKSAPLSEDERIHHVLARLTYGPQPGEVERVRELGLEAWLEKQLGSPGAGQRVAGLVRPLSTLGLSPKEQDAAYEAVGSDGMDRNAFRRQVQRELVDSVVLRALASEAQLEEVIVDFWRNHFNVDVTKDSVGWTATHYEEAVLRRHALGDFDDFLMATAKHPSMLVYLDNHISRGPPSRSELRRIERQVREQTGSRELAKEQVAIAKQRGLNENYARELMELHTLGVDNGYTQADVVQVAQALTGWSVDFSADGSGFRFKHDMHLFGPKRLMGRGLPQGKRETGIKTGEAVVKRLSAHKNTAGFIATKLTRWLVNDEPPAAIVDEAAKVFKKSKGDIRATVRAIIDHEEFFAREHYRAKFKTPLEFVVSALRATNAEVQDASYVHRILRDLRMPVYQCEDPTGYRDQAESWRDPGVMALRWRFAIDLAMGRAAGLSIPDSLYRGLPEDPIEITELLTKRIIPAGLGEATSAVLERVVFQIAVEGGADTPAKRLKFARQVTGILLGSPEFQQQ